MSEKAWLYDIPMKDDTKRVRIRGIYATALTKFFLDHNYTITQPSEAIIERFNIKDPVFLSPHIDIQTKGSRGTIECVERYSSEIKSLLLTNFKDLIIYQLPVSKNSIWKGVITKKTKDGYWVQFSLNLGGFLPNSNSSHPYREGDPIVVEVQNIDPKTGKIILTDTISIPGEYVVLIKKEIVKVSRKIKGTKKVELLDLGNILRPPGWGAIFRTSAMYADIEDISAELQALQKYSEELLKSTDTVPAFTQIREGINIMNVYFPKNTKKALDDIRSQVTTTINNHHWLKTLGKASSFLVDFVETNIEKLSAPLDVISELVTNYVRKTLLPSPGQIIKIYHIKPNLKRITLGPAKIIQVEYEDNNSVFYMFRRFAPGGYYDGINAPKESGDFGITIARENDTKLVTAYFDMNSNLKGIYINVNTPIEVYPKSIRYVDLEIDVVLTSTGDIVIIDRQKLDKYLELGAISEDIYRLAQEKAIEYKSWLENGGKELILDKCEQIIDQIEEDLLEA